MHRVEVFFGQNFFGSDEKKNYYARFHAEMQSVKFGSFWLLCVDSFSQTPSAALRLFAPLREALLPQQKAPMNRITSVEECDATKAP